MNLSTIGEFVFYDKYSRWDENKGRRETWKEAVTRTVNFLKDLSGNKLSSREYAAIRKAMLNGDIAASMRLFRTAGPAAERNHVAIYNCAYMPISALDAFWELLFISMSGVGVGYSVERRYTSMLPVVKKAKDEDPDVMVIEDTTEGWVEALKQGILAWYDGREIVFDYSKIRPAGAPLKIKGGTASGPAVLEDMLDFTRMVIRNREGGKLAPIDAFDICTKIGDAAVSGGSRRSAQLCMFDLGDNAMMTAKKGAFWEHSPHRANANISVVLEDLMSRDELAEIMNVMFDNETGEPGIVSRMAMKATAPGRRRYMEHGGVNACQPDFATVLSRYGITTMGRVDIGDDIWDGEKWVTISNKVMTGTDDVYAYYTSFGTFIGTKDHMVSQLGERVDVGSAEYIDAIPGPPLDNARYVLNPRDVMDGLVIGDGSVHAASNNLVHLYVGENDSDYFSSEVAHLFVRQRAGLSEYAWEVDTSISPNELPLTYDRIVPERFYRGTRITKMGFLRGLFSANGYAVNSGKSHRIGLKQSSHTMIRQVQEMLSSLGIQSYVTVTAPKVIEWPNGVYESRESYDLNITSDRYEFLDKIGFIQEYKNNTSGGVSRGSKSGIVQRVEYLGAHDVYDITVDSPEHYYWSGGLKVSNCAEINLHGATQDGRFGGQFCNLSTVHVREDDTLETLKKKVELATIIGTIQSMATEFGPMLRPEWREICEEERLLGVSLIGIMDNPVARHSGNLNTLRRLAVETNKKYAEKLGIAQSAAVTAIKPAGNSSVMFNTARGINTRFAPYYIRRVRVNRHTPIWDVLSKSGIPMEKSKQGEDTWVATFYEKSPDTAVLDLSAIQQLENWKNAKFNYTEHNVSVTIEYRKSEREKIINWLFDNQKMINGIAFLPRDDHLYEQAPYEEITEEQYIEAMSSFPETIDWTLLNEDKDNTTGTAECGSVVCELV